MLKTFLETITERESRFTFGVEIEIPINTSVIHIEDFLKKFKSEKIETKLSWNYHHDPSCPNSMEISTEDGYYLTKLNDLKSDIESFNQYFKDNSNLISKDHNFSRECGTHIHIGTFDLNSKEDLKLKQIVFYNWKNILSKFARFFVEKNRYESASRSTSYYRHFKDEHRFNDIMDIKSFEVSFARQNTIEFRLKEWTLDSNEIVNLVDICANIISGAEELKNTGDLSSQNIAKILNQNYGEIKKYIRKVYSKKETDTDEKSKINNKFLELSKNIIEFQENNTTWKIRKFYPNKYETIHIIKPDNPIVKLENDLIFSILFYIPVYLIVIITYNQEIEETIKMYVANDFDVKNKMFIGTFNIQDYDQINRMLKNIKNNAAIINSKLGK